MTKTATKPALVLRDKLVLVAGTHNGINYSEDEVRKLYQLYKQMEAKPKNTRSIDEVHAFDIYRGDDEDHKDSSGTWVGDVEGVYWDETHKGFGFKTWNIVDETFARNINYQKQRGVSSFGVSPRLNVLRVGTEARDIRPKNIAIVLTPAGGQDLMLNRSEMNEDGREQRQDIVQEITLSEQESLTGKGGIEDMDGTEILNKVGELINSKFEELKKEQAESKLNEELTSLKSKVEELSTKNSELQTELQKKKKDEEDMAGKGKDKDEEMQAGKDKKKDDEEMQKDKDKKKDDEEMQKDKTKYKYYGALSAKDSLLKQFRLTPDLSALDAQSVNRVAEDLFKASKVFDGEFTLEQAQKGIEEIQAILANLPGSAKEEKELMENIETTLSSMSGQIAAKLDEKLGGAGARRKGLIVGGGAGRTDEALSANQQGSNQNQNTNRSADDIASDMRQMLYTGLKIGK